MSENSLHENIICDKCNEPMMIRSVVRKEQLGFMEKTASEALEEEHRKLAETESDEFQREIHRQLAEAQRKLRQEGYVKLILQCPTHSIRKDYSLGPDDVQKYATEIKTHLFRCAKCGQPVELIDTKQTGKDTIINIQCQEHKKGKRTVSTIYFDTIMGAESTAPPRPVTPAQPVAPSQPEPRPAPATPLPPSPGDIDVKFCWNCGAKTIAKGSQYCYKCGVSLRPS